MARISFIPRISSPRLQISACIVSDTFARCFQQLKHPSRPQIDPLNPLNHIKKYSQIGQIGQIYNRLPPPATPSVSYSESQLTAFLHISATSNSASRTKGWTSVGLGTLGTWSQGLGSMEMLWSWVDASVGKHAESSAQLEARHAEIIWNMPLNLKSL
jgi:hypothetical protein